MQVGLYHHQRKSVGVWRIVSEDSEHGNLQFAIAGLVFPADCLHRTDFHCSLSRKRLANEYQSDTQVFQHIAKFYNYDWFIVTAAVYRGFGRKLRNVNIANLLP